MPIAGLSEQRRLPRLGKIHLGIKKKSAGGAEYPASTDYFVLPQDNPAYNELVRLFGDKPKELRILIPVEDAERWASQYYKAYSRTRGLICRGDGAVALRMIDTATGTIANRDTKTIEMREIPCQGRSCPEYTAKPQACREMMNLQFLIPEVPGLGVWQIDTSSINSIRNINSEAALIKRIYGRIAMMPLSLTLEPQEVNNPDDGKKKTVHVMHLRSKANLLELVKASQAYQLNAGPVEIPEPDDSEPEIIEAEVADPAPEVRSDDERLFAPEETQPVQKAPAQVVTAKRTSKVAATYPQEKTSADSVTEKDITTIYQLKQMCFKLWKMQPPDVLAELGVKADSDLAEKPWDCFLKIKAVKSGPTS